jgi:two-component system cell cycle sensor histidine kinase/response regulator CckA
MGDAGIAESAASRQLARTRAQLEGLLRALPDIYFRLDAAGCIVAWHAGSEAELHVPPEQFIGRKPEDVVPPQVAPLIAVAVERARSGGEVVVVEYTLPTPSGDDQFEAWLVACGDGEVTSVIRNTTPRRRAEAALQATEERLQAAQKLEAVGRLAGGVAHDFNNLLTVILGRLTFLKRSAGLRDVDRDHVCEAFEATSRAASLTRQLLAFSRRQVMQPVVFPLNEVLESMREILRGVLGEHIEVLMALDSSTGLIDADPTQIEQVVLNLVLNARDAMPDGGTLIVSTRQMQLSEEDARQRDDAKPGPYVVLSVSDTGRGMTPEVMAHLFEPFFTTKPQGEGTGLGLATVYGIVKQSRGHAIVRSDVGVGSTFELSFPRATRSEPALAIRSTPPSPATLRGAGERILVVEDEDGVRGLLVKILTDASYAVRSAVCGEEAIRMALDDGERLSLLLTDVVMPGMNGFVLASRVRLLRPDVRVLLMSGHEGSLAGHPGDPERALPILEKPFTEAALLTRIREVLEESPSPPAMAAIDRDACLSTTQSKT